MNTPTITEQITCARRELALRRSCYPKWVQSGRMSQPKADAEIVAMSAIIETLEKLQDATPEK